MMRTTTGRQLVEIAQAPKGSSKTAAIELEGGQSIDVELGGGVVTEGGRVIKSGEALENLLEELEWVLPNPTFPLKRPQRSSTACATLWSGPDFAEELNSQRCLKQRSSVHSTHCSKRATGTLTPAFAASSMRAMFRWSSCWWASTVPEKPPLRQRLPSDCSTTGTASSPLPATPSERARFSNLNPIANAWVYGASPVNAVAIRPPSLAMQSIQRKPKASTWCWSIRLVRMQNKTNLMNELNKVRKVTNPHLTLFVGDSLAGNDAVEQAKMFQKSCGLTAPS